MHTHTRALFPPALAAAALAGLPLHAQGGFSPEWIARLPVGTTLTSGLQGMVVDAAGVIYVTGNTGSSSNTDIVTAAFDATGTLLWSHVFDGPARWHDQARGLALGPGGSLYVTGNTPGLGSYANVLLLQYDIASGALRNTVQYSSGPSISEHGASVAVDQAGNVYVGGGTVGDGTDGMLLKFDASGTLLWRRTWDGAAFGPFSQDQLKRVRIAPNGDPIVLLHGVTGANQPDYVVVAYTASNGSIRWETSWGTRGGEYPHDMKLDAAGDVYVSGIGIDVSDKYATIKLRGADGAVLWQAYDSGGFHPAVRALALDTAGGVYVTGSVDPDGDRSNNNDDFYTVKRDAGSGALLWTHRYGAGCVGCLDLPADLIVDVGGSLFLSGSTSSPPYSAAMITFVLDSISGVEVGRSAVTAGQNQAAGAAVLALDPAQNLLIGGQWRDANTFATEITVVRYPTQASVRSSGSGCRGSGALPLAAAAVGLPRIPNPTFAIDLHDGPTALVHGVVLARGPAAVPIQFGAPGCTVQIDLATYAGTLLSGSASLPLPIPAVNVLRGQRIALQGLVVDASTTQLVTSNSLWLLLGR